MGIENNGIPAIKVDNLTVSFGPRPALLNVNVSVEQGLLVGIIGPNGAGKSTLVKSILGFVKPDLGSIQLLGKPIEKAKGQLAYVPQRGAVDWDYPITVYEVAMMGRYPNIPWWRDPGKEDREIVDKALEMVRMSDFRNRRAAALPKDPVPPVISRVLLSNIGQRL